MQLFGSVPLQHHEQAVDTTALVRSCVQSAVGMLRDQAESGLRSAQRVEILLTLLCDHDDIKGDTHGTWTLSFRISRIRFYSVSYPTLDRGIPANPEDTSSLDAADAGEQRSVVREEQLGHQGGFKL